MTCVSFLPYKGALLQKSKRLGHSAATPNPLSTLKGSDRKTEIKVRLKSDSKVKIGFNLFSKAQSLTRHTLPRGSTVNEEWLPPKCFPWGQKAGRWTA